MSADPRQALNVLVAALERHLEACSSRHGDDDPTVAAAYDDLADAFEAYDAALYDAYGEMTPLDVYSGEDDEDEDGEDEDGEDEDGEDDDDLDEDDDDDGGLYAGLGGDDIEQDSR